MSLPAHRAPAELIRLTRDGGVLSDQETTSLVAGITHDQQGVKMRMKRFVTLLAAATIAVATGCRGEMAADTIYTNGDIITMNDAQPSAEAVAVKGGRILAVGTREAIERAHKSSSTRVGR